MESFNRCPVPSALPDWSSSEATGSVPRRAPEASGLEQRRTCQDPSPVRRVAVCGLARIEPWFSLLFLPARLPRLLSASNARTESQDHCASCPKSHVDPNLSHLIVHVGPESLSRGRVETTFSFCS